MRFAIKTAPQDTAWSAMRDVWCAADDIPLFESAWTYDHFEAVDHPLTGPVPRQLPVFEAWTTLAALGALTRRIRVGVMVTGVPYRHPALVAKMACTVDALTDGRLELGLGAGWNTVEAAAVGLDLPPLRERFDRFDEALDVIVAMLAGPEGAPVEHHGRHFHLTDAWCEPKPVQRPHPPITIGGSGERRTLPTVARVAQRWNTPFVDEATFARKRAVLAECCAAIGRDVTEIDVSNQIQFTGPGPTADACARFAELGMDLAVVYLPEHDPRVLEPLAEALAPLAS